MYTPYDKEYNELADLLVREYYPQKGKAQLMHNIVLTAMSNYITRDTMYELINALLKFVEAARDIPELEVLDLIKRAHEYNELVDNKATRAQMLIMPLVANVMHDHPWSNIKLAALVEEVEYLLS